MKESNPLDKHQYGRNSCRQNVRNFPKAAGELREHGFKSKKPLTVTTERWNKADDVAILASVRQFGSDISDWPIEDPKVWSKNVRGEIWNFLQVANLKARLTCESMKIRLQFLKSNCWKQIAEIVWHFTVRLTHPPPPKHVNTASHIPGIGNVDSASKSADIDQLWFRIPNYVPMIRYRVCFAKVLAPRDGPVRCPIILNTGTNCKPPWQPRRKLVPVPPRPHAVTGACKKNCTGVSRIVSRRARCSTTLGDGSLQFRSREKNLSGSAHSWVCARN